MSRFRIDGDIAPMTGDRVPVGVLNPESALAGPENMPKSDVALGVINEV